MDQSDARFTELEQRFERRLRRRTRVVAGLAVLALVVGLVPMVALAVTFGDVPNSNPFAGDIGRVSNAGISAGCGGGNYCPGQAVTREQMAAFLSRTGGRVAFDSFTGLGFGGSPVTGATVVIKAGNVAGGTAFVKLSTAYAVSVAVGTGFPYEAEVTLRHNGAYLSNTVNQLAAPNGTFAADSGAMDWVLAVPTGVAQTFTVDFWRLTGASTMGAWGTLTAEYLPFSEDGDDVLTIVDAGLTP